MANNSSSALIDRNTSEALLAQAAKEKLVWTTRETDGVFEKIVQADYNPLVVHQLRERLVLNPKLVLYGFPDFLWEALDGPLKDGGHIANIEKQEEDTLRLKEIPLDVLSGMLGRVVTEKELRATISNIQAAYTEQGQYEVTSGKPVPDVFQEDLSRVLRKARISECPSSYTKEEIEVQRARNAIFRTFNPFAKALEEYSHLASVAMRCKVLLGTPLLATETAAVLLNPTFQPQAHDSDVALFRIVCNELGRTTFRPTLKGTLELSREPTTKALRDMMQLWISGITVGNDSELARIRVEISLATTALQNLKGVQTAGRITTWIAIPIALVELVLALPPLMGVTASSIGVFALGKEQRLREQYLWASYGGV